jgi:hypothetical protein
MKLSFRNSSNPLRIAGVYFLGVVILALVIIPKCQGQFSCAGIDIVLDPLTTPANTLFLLPYAFVMMGDISPLPTFLNSVIFPLMFTVLKAATNAILLYFIIKTITDIINKLRKNRQKKNKQKRKRTAQ